MLLMFAGRVSDKAGHSSSVSRSVCLACCRSMPVTKAGLLRVHGPLGNRCAGVIVMSDSPVTGA